MESPFHLLIGLALLVLFTGIAGCTDSTETRGETDPGAGQISIYLTELNSTDTEFVVEGESDFWLTTDASVTFEEAMVCAYDRDSRFLNGTPIGSLTQRTHRSFHLHTATRPSYIVVSHPDIARYDGFDDRGIEFRPRFDRASDWNDYVVSPIHFEYPTDDSARTCPESLKFEATTSVSSQILLPSSFSRSPH